MDSSTPAVPPELLTARQHMHAWRNHLRAHLESPGAFPCDQCDALCVAATRAAAQALLALNNIVVLDERCQPRP